MDLEAVRVRNELFRPISAMAYNPRFNFDGFINERGGDRNNGYTQVFRNGVVEATKANIIIERDGLRWIPGIGTEQHLFQILPTYMEGLRQIDVSPPLIVMISFEDVQGVIYPIREGIFGEYNPPFDRRDILLPECVLEEYGDVAYLHRCLKPAFDALWNAIGHSGWGEVDAAGVWRAPNYI